MPDEAINLDSYRMLMEDDLVEELVSIARHPEAHVLRKQAKILQDIASQLEWMAADIEKRNR